MRCSDCLTKTYGLVEILSDIFEFSSDRCLSNVGCNYNGLNVAKFLADSFSACLKELMGS